MFITNSNKTKELYKLSFKYKINFVGENEDDKAIENLSTLEINKNAMLYYTSYVVQGFNVYL